MVYGILWSKPLLQVAGPSSQPGQSAEAKLAGSAPVNLTSNQETNVKNKPATENLGNVCTDGYYMTKANHEFSVASANSGEVNSDCSQVIKHTCNQDPINNPPKYLLVNNSEVKVDVVDNSANMENPVRGVTKQNSQELHLNAEIVERLTSVQIFKTANNGSTASRWETSM